jgi:hypothetical protein
MAVKVKMVEAPMPKGRGLDVSRVDWIDIKFLKHHYKKVVKTNGGVIKSDNDARANMLNETVIQAFIFLIENGLYEKDHHIPPVVIRISDTEYIMVSGEHRLTAHQRAGKTKMWVAVCEFVPTAGKSAGYWKRKYQSNENNPRGRMDSNSRTDADIISIVMADIREGDFKITEEENILESLKDQHIKDLKKRQDLANIIMNLDPSVSGVPRSGNKNFWKTYIKGCIQDKEQSFNGSEPDHIQKGDGTEIDPDYVDRTLRVILAGVLNNVLPKTQVALHWGGMSGKDLYKSRENADDYFFAAIKRAFLLTDLVKSGQFQKMVDVNLISQFRGEVEPYVQQSIKLNYPEIK